jgi:hypothetical protein
VPDGLGARWIELEPGTPEKVLVGDLCTDRNPANRQRTVQLCREGICVDSPLEDDHAETATSPFLPRPLE